MIAVIDYGAGNLKSVTKALDHLGYANTIVSRPEELETADGMILPGVGAFPMCMAALRKSGMDQAILQQAGKKPLLGICLGMQMLLDSSTEMGGDQGLGLIPGTVEKIETKLKLPHIGWNSLNIVNPNPLTAGLSDGDYVYFVHSFCGLCDRETDAAAFTDYGVPVLAMTARGNLFGCQFHPEKSGEVGLTILRNFGGLCQ